MFADSREIPILANVRENTRATFFPWLFLSVEMGERESVSVARCFARPLGAVGMRRVRLESQILIGNTGSNDLFHLTIVKPDDVSVLGKS